MSNDFHLSIVKKWRLDAVKNYFINECNGRWQNTEKCFQIIAVAAKYGHLHIIEYLKSVGLTANLIKELPNVHKAVMCAFIAATMYGSFKVIQYFVNEFELTSEDIKYQDNSALYCAAKRGNCDTVDYLLRIGDIDLCQIPDIELILALPMSMGHKDIVRLFIDRGITYEQWKNASICIDNPCYDYIREYYETTGGSATKSAAVK